MKLFKLSVKSFKSIDLIEEFDINNPEITSIIGKNGSGKSNILDAINALKSSHQLIDSNRFEKINKDNEIKIQAYFSLGEADEDLFNDSPIELKDLDGFIVIV